MNTELNAPPAAFVTPESPATQLRKKSELAIAAFLESLGSLSVNDVSSLLTVKLIEERDRGDDTPVESFISSLILFYQSYEDKGDGLPLWLIEQEFNQFRETFNEHVKRCHFIAKRYPMPAEGEKEA